MGNTPNFEKETMDIHGFQIFKNCFFFLLKIKCNNFKVQQIVKLGTSWSILLVHYLIQKYINEFFNWKNIDIIIKSCFEILDQKINLFCDFGVFNYKYFDNNTSEDLMLLKGEQFEKFNHVSKLNLNYYIIKRFQNNVSQISIEVVNVYRFPKFLKYLIESAILKAYKLILL